ncbi:titin homolog [Littorina saxatilis]|uniref:Uncharacterized protein n=1 Tax=Littorina saxatilis TaxID=31220 RepID=A0AAN9GMS4_9CAEN
MPEENEVARVSWWPTSKMPGEAVEEALDYLYFMQEVTNAYAMELTWALALVLGLTCLYIWRALGLQEGERLHSKMVTSRPVFSSTPTPASAEPSSAFLAAYKNRFAHKEKSTEEERVNAVGYDILHTYNNPPPYRHRVVPRAVWKRHSSGLEIERTPIQSLWDCDTGSVGPWNNIQAMPVYPSFASAPGYKRNSGSNRQESKDVKDVRSQHYPYSHTQSIHHQHQQQIQLQKVHQQMMQQQQQKQKHTSSFNEAKDNAELVRQSAGNLPRRYRTPSPRFRQEYPVPAAREPKTPPPVKPRKDTLLAHPEQQAKGVDGETQKVTHGNNVKSASNHHKKERVVLHKRGEPEAVITDVTTTYVNAVKELLLSERKMQDSSRPSEQEKQTKTLAAVAALESKEEQPVHPDTANTPVHLMAEADSQGKIVERLKQELLHPEVTSYKLSSSVLDTAAEPQSKVHKEAARRQRNVDRELEHSRNSHGPCDAPLPAVKRSKTKVSHLAKKTSDTRVCKKRSKTLHKSDSRGSTGSKGSRSKRSSRTNEEQYDSAVLRAIKAEDECKKSDKSKGSTCGSSKPGGSLGDREKNPKQAGGDGEQDRIAPHEAGKRLAKLRKRLEDSLELIQKQPGLDKELAEKARCSKMRQRREELEKLTFMKDDILELETLTCIAKSREEMKANAKPTANADPMLKQAAKKSVKADDISAAKGADDEPRCSTKQESYNISKFVSAYSTENGVERQENSVTQISTKVTEYASQVDHERAPQKLEDDATKDGDNVRPRQLEKQPHTNEKDMSGRAKVHVDSQDADGDNTSPARRSRDSSVNEKPIRAGEPEKIITRSGRVLDANSLDEIIERQCKRREVLRQRKRSPAAEEDSITPKMTRSESASACEDNAVQAASTGAPKPQVVLGQGPGQRRSSADRMEARIQRTEIKDSKPSSIIINGTPYVKAPVTLPPRAKAEDNCAEEDTSQYSGQTGDDQSPMISDLDISPYVSKRTLGYLKYEEPEVQPKKPSSTTETKTSPERLWRPVFDPLFAGERESSARRRVRWRRQAERVERQRADGDDRQKVPPPVLPKLTRLDDLMDNNASQVWSTIQEINAANAPIQYQPKSKPWELRESSDNTPRAFQEKAPAPEKPVLSPRPVPRTFVKEKNMDLAAAGELGVIKDKGPPQNVEICVEKSLTPSKAASVFDPKAQLEREKEKAEVDRAAIRSHIQEGMPPSKFKANVHLFEQAAATGGVTPIDSKVKANVRMFEAATRGDRGSSCSPERRGPLGMTGRSPSSPRP